MRLAVIGDIHARRSRLEPVLERIAATRTDGVLLVGDLGPHLPPRREPSSGELRRYLRAVDGLLDAIAALGRPLAWVPGNHDRRDLPFPGNIDGDVVNIDGVRIAGLGGSPDHRGDPYEWTDDEVRARTFPPADILVSHTPPARTPLDLVPRRREHVGSEAVRELALARGGVVVCGHIHESPGACRIGDALCLNAGGLGRPFGKAQVGWVTLQEGRWAVGHEDLEAETARWWTLQQAPDATTPWVEGRPG